MSTQANQFKALDTIGQHEDRLYAAGQFKRHKGVEFYLKTLYIRTARSFGYVRANNQLRETCDSLVFAQGVSATVHDDQIISMAEVNARKAKNIYHHYRAYSDITTVADRLIRFCDSEGVIFPLKITRNDDQDSIARKTIAAAERTSDERWWRRQLRTLMVRQTEGVLRKTGFVRKGKSPYLSNWTMQRWLESQKRNKKTLAALEVVSNEGEAVDLLDCVESSISNPTNRRHELMTRSRGYEEIAKGMGLIGLFFTLTCPSKFHAQTRNGINKKYDGSSPIDAMAHLNSTWAKIRSAWHKDEIKTFGFRVAEPHHDGTPHFHLLLFFNPADIATAKSIFGEYALEVDGGEPGAAENRWDCKEIDPAKGSAAGYIAKYIAKNLDGAHVDTDDEGEVWGNVGASRVRAWASVWGIRQFQQIGSVSVTVWRELRRDIEYFEHLITSEPSKMHVVDRLRVAADEGNWSEFVELMGGAFVSRDDQTLRPMYHESEPGVVDSRYGEGVKRLIGLWLNPVVKAIDRIIFTRTKVWEIRQKERERGLSFKAAQPPLSDLCQ